MATLSSAAGLLPHGFCYQWRPELLWTHVLSDGVIALAYFSIPVTLVYFLSRRKGMKLWWVVALFAAFIVLCGATHIMGILTVWEPVYSMSAGVKLATALVSLTTAAAIVPLVPRALTLRTAQELEEANRALQEEISLRKEAENELALKLSELRNSNRELEQFAYVASHDLQAPLRNIISFTSIVEEECEGKLSDECKEYFEFIRRGGHHMQQLIVDLLELSRIGPAAARPEKVALKEALEDTKSLLATDIQESGAELKITGGELPVVEVDRNQLLQLLQNLIANAIKFRKEDVKPLVTISASTDQDMCHVVIADNGIGMPPDMQKKVFDIFKRLHGESAYDGTGIGLSICRKVVQGHGGEIWVESEPGQGSRFQFTLPLAGKSESRWAELREVPLPPGS